MTDESKLQGAGPIAPLPESGNASSQIRGDLLSPWRRLTYRIWGYDFFVSYHWASGGNYASELARVLRERGYDCFLDRSEFASGDDWVIEAKRALQHTQRLVLIATMEAITESPPVTREIGIFTERSRHIIPIVFGVAFTNQQREQYPILKKIPESQLYINEQTENQLVGPSVAVVDQLIRTHKVLRRRTIRTWVVATIFVVLSLATAVATFSYVRASLARIAEKVAKTKALHELTTSHWQLAVVARDRDSNPVRATHEFLLAARAAAEAGDQVAYRNLLLAADAATGHLQQTISHSKLISGYAISLNRDQLLTWSQPEGLVKLWAPPVRAPVQTLNHHHIGGATFSADGSHILTWSYPPRENDFSLHQRFVSLWTVGNKEPIRHFPEHCGAIFLGISNQVATWDSHSEVYLWQSAQDKPVRVIGTGHRVTGAASTNDGRWLLTWGDRDPVSLWDTVPPEPTRTSLTAKPGSAIFSKDDNRILTWDWNGEGAIWEVSPLRKLRDIKHELNIIGGVFDPGGSRALTWSHDKSARLWDIAGTEPLRIIRHNQSINGATFNHSGTRILTWGNDGRVLLHDAVAPYRELSQYTHGGEVNGAVFNTGDTRIFSWNNNIGKVWDATFNDINSNPLGVIYLGTQVLRKGSGDFWGNTSTVVSSDGDESMRLWNMSRAIEPLRTFDPGKGRLLGARLIQQGTQVCIWSSDGQISIWHLLRAEPARVLRCGMEFEHVEVSPEGNFAVTFTADNDLGKGKQAKLWNISGASATFVAELTHENEIKGITFRSSGTQFLTYGADKTCKLWDAADGELVWKYQHTDEIGGASLSPDGKHIVAWPSKNLLSFSSSKPLLLAVGQRVPKRTFAMSSRCEQAVFSSDGSHVLTFGNNEAQWWDLKEAEPRFVLTHNLRMLNPETQINGAILLSKPDRALVWDNHSRIILWDLDTGIATKTFRHTGAHGQSSIEQVVLSPDQSLFLSCNRGGFNTVGTIWLWDITRLSPIRIWEAHRTFRSAEFNHNCTGLLMRRDERASIWDLSVPKAHVTSDELIRDFEARSGTRLDASGEMVYLPIR